MNTSRTKQAKANQGIIDSALRELEAATGLTAEIDKRPIAGGDAYDVRVRIGRDNHRQGFLAVARTRLPNEIVGAVIAQLRDLKLKETVLITPYITLQQADRLRLAGIQFIDKAGNAFIDRPPTYIFVAGRRPKIDRVPEQKSRALTATGIKVLFALLSRPQLAGQTYRSIAVAADVSLGAVNQIVDDLKRTGYLIEKKAGGRVLHNREDLVRRWAEAYAERLRPKLLFGRYTAETSNWWNGLRLEKKHACWGGEAAAGKLTGYLKPQMMTIYAPGKLPDLQVKFGFRQDRDGEIEILKKFWVIEGISEHPDLAPPLLIYADLITSGDERNIETARMIYEQYLDRSFREA